ncbi:MAG: Hpt domain-containing protein, partial [Candidatus Margulisbacteria bacterium]|nr:Hpt domain-containing protein [Candidatus Margulisiibacteriota bacterium]
MANEQYKEIFLSEAKEILGNLNNNLVLLEKDAKNPEVINEIFRAAHTLKGMSATMGYEPLVKLSHTLESDFDLVRSQKINVDNKLTDLFFEAADKLDEGVKLVANNKLEKFNAEELVSKLKAILGNGQVVEAKVESAPAEVCLLLTAELKEKIAAAVKQGLVAWQVSFSLAKECTMCYPRSMVVLQHLQAIGDVLDYKKLIINLKEKNIFKRVVFYFLSSASEDEIRQRLSN